MKIYKNRTFDRWARKEGLNNLSLCNAVNEMAAGLYDADLGSGLFKKRIAKPGKGKSGGFRTLVATNNEDRWFFIFGFEKNQRSNINNAELAHLQAISERLLHLTAQEIDTLVKDKILTEIKYDNDKKIQPHH